MRPPLKARSVLAIALVLAGVLCPAIVARTAMAAGTCISSVGTHRDYFSARDGYFSYEWNADHTSSIRVGIEVRQVSDCTSGALKWIDATACMQNVDPGPPGFSLRAMHLKSVALYGTTGTLLANNNVGAYENYRDGAGPVKICASTPRVYVGEGGNAVKAAVQAAHTSIASIARPYEYTYQLRVESYDSPPRYRRV